MLRVHCGVQSIHFYDSPPPLLKYNMKKVSPFELLELVEIPEVKPKDKRPRFLKVRGLSFKPRVCTSSIFLTANNILLRR